MSTPVADAELSARRRLRYVLALGFLQTLGTLTIDIYLPAFPAISADFSASDAAIQLTLSAAMAGGIAGQLAVGVWSDAAGRRVPLLVAALTHVAASLACAAAPGIGWLVAARFVQGAAAASTGVVALAMVRDLYSGARMVRMLASLALIFGLAIAAGPLLGSALLTIMDWRGVFLSLAGYGLVVGLGAFVMVRETLPSSRRVRTPGRTVLGGFAIVLKDRACLGLIVTSGLIWAGMYAYLASSSFLFQDVFGLTQSGYGLVFASHAILMLAGNQASAVAVRRLRPRSILAIATTGLGVAAAIMTVVGLSGGGGLFGFLVPLWLFTFMLGSVNPCLQAMVLARHGERAGSASALLRTANNGFGALSAPVVGIVAAPGVAAVAVTVLVCELLGVAVFWILGRRQSQNPASRAARLRP